MPETPTTYNYYPALSRLITLDDFPEVLGFIKGGLQDLFDKIYYKDFQSSSNISGSGAFYSLDIISRQRVEIELPGTGIFLVLNPDYDDETISSFPIQLQWEWEIMRFVQHFEIIIDADHLEVNLESLRNTSFPISVSSLPPITPAEKFAQKVEREKILSFIDPAAFFGMHYDIGVKVSTYPSSGNKQTEKKKKDILYADLISKFATKNRVYIDIRGERGYSYNFYDNYGDTNDNLLKVKAESAPDFTDDLYYTNKWPIFFDENPISPTGRINKLQIKLRIDDNIKPLLFLRNSTLRGKLRKKHFINEKKLLDGTSVDWSKAIQLKIPNTGSSPSKVNVAWYVQLQYFKQDENESDPSSVPVNHDSLDCLVPDINLPYRGGANSNGVLFKILPDGTGYTKLLDFDWPNGHSPGSLILDDGFLYGMTNSGGPYSGGVIFKISTNGTGFTKLLDFNGENGKAPYGSLIFEGGFLYGMTSSGGANDDGTIFRILPDGTGYTKLLDFDVTIGNHPLGSLISDGTFLYGMTSKGGSIQDLGTIFKFCLPANGTDIQVACESFTWIDGNTYTTSNNTATHTIIGGTANGCDSIVTLDLTINNPTFGTDIQTVCESFTWIDGNTYTENNNSATHTIIGGAANGCDSIVTLNLTINNVATGTDIQIACESFTWIDGNTYTESNNSATHTIIGGAANGCDSIVTLDLTINNPTFGTDVQVACESFTWIDGNTYTESNNTATHTIIGGAANGCDSIVTLDLTINNVATGTDVRLACGVFTWIDGNIYTVSNNSATHTIAGGAINGCDSIVTLDLTIEYLMNTTDVHTACESFTWIDGITYTASNNTATVLFTNEFCDSIITLDLTIINPSTKTDIQTACESFTWIDGNTYTESNNSATYTIAGGAVNGCDSIVMLDLTINNPTTGTDVQTACESFTWIDGNTYTESNNSATHTIVSGSANGCDSIVTLDLTINNPTTGTDVQTACESFTWIDGNTYTESNNSATHTIVSGSANGCDSIVTLDLTINNPTTGTDVQTACESFTWIDGNTYTESNNSATYTIAGGAANGCDSIVTLDLTINTVNTDITQIDEIYLSADEVDATYQWINCDDNTIIAGETNQTFTVTENGNYAVIITQGECTDTSSCITLSTVGIENLITSKEIKIFPNPTNKFLNIHINNHFEEGFSLAILDETGRVVKEQKVMSKEISLDISKYQSGVYFIRLSGANEQFIYKVVKQ